jgi:hypothetical protein
MNASPLEILFGRSRLDVSTGRHAQVIREAAAPGERRRFTKRFLATPDGDFRHWTGREARILAHLKAHGVRSAAELVGLQAGALQTFDAGVTVEQWATMLPVERDGHVLPHVFADCAHWWALAHHTLRALETIHALQVVHLEVKPDNICVPALGGDQATADGGSAIGLKFARLALIDFAFSLSSVEPLAVPLPVGTQVEYPYQSPRLLRALAAGRLGNLRRTQVLDWRCDLYSLGAMLRTYLPAAEAPFTGHDGWTDERRARAVALLAALGDAHDREIAAAWPHQALIDACETELHEPELVGSLLEGFTLAPSTAAAALRPPATASTCIASSIPIVTTPAAPTAAPETPPVAANDVNRAPQRAPEPSPARGPQPSVDDRLGAFEPPVRSRRRARAIAGAGALFALVAAAGLGLYAYEHRRDGAVTSAGNDSVTRVAVAPRVARPAPRSPDSAQSAPSRDVPVVVARDDAAAREPVAASAPTPATAAASSAAAARSVNAQTSMPSPAARAVNAPASIASPGGRTVNPSVPSPAVPRSAAARSDEPGIAAMPVRAVDDVAAETERDVARVLALAAHATSRADEDKVVQVARSIRPIASAPHPPTESPSVARRLNAEARTAWERGDLDRALRLQQRAFRANPNDAEVTGNLAFFYLKVRPAQPALARRLALYALAARGQRFPAGRVEDWGTFAVASSLEGRQSDAIKAMYVMSTVSSNPERACGAARLAVAQYGETMKAPADAMLVRIRQSGSAQRAPSCG